MYADAQVEYGGIPLSRKHNLSFENIANTILPTLGKSDIHHYDTTGTYYLGPRRTLDVDVLTEGTKTVIDSDIITLYRVKSLGTKVMYVIFDKFILSDKTKVFIHYGNGGIKGSYRKLNVATSKNKIFSGPRIPADECIVEIDSRVGDLNNVHLSSVAHLIFAKSGSSNLRSTTSTNSSCNMNVNCPQADAWCNQIRSVAQCEFPSNDGFFLCGGALINNFRQDFAQYFYTADHCITDVTDFEGAKFYFNYESPDCEGNYGDYDYAVNGCEVLSICDVGNADNALLQITEPIPLQYNVYFSGFDVARRHLYDDVHCIHFPLGDPKKITAGRIQNFLGPVWDVDWFNGALFEGSSGGPVFLDANKRIIANVHGGFNYDCDSYLKHDLVGKLRSCFQFASMKYILSYGIGGIGGIDPVKACQDHIELFGFFRPASSYRTVKPDILLQANLSVDISSTSESNFVSDADFNIQAGDVISLHPGTNIFSGSKVHLYIAPCVNTEDNCGFNYTASKTIEAANTREDADFILEQESSSFSLIIYPNPSMSECHLIFDIATDAKVNIEMLDITGRAVKQIDHRFYMGGHSQVDFTTGDVAAGVYMIRYSDSNGNTITKRLVVDHGGK